MNLQHVILAQATTQPAGTQPGGDAATPVPQPSFFSPPIFGLLLAFAVFYYFIFRAQRRERRKHDQMLSALKRNDRVQTIGGIIGTVVDVRDHEVVLKVDENSNVKIRFNRAAIKDVLREGTGEAGEQRGQK